MLSLILLGASPAVPGARDGGASAGKGKPASTGIDPTEIIGRYALNYAYVEKDTGTKRHNLGMGFEKNVGPSAKVGVTVPLTYAEAADGTTSEGVGDVKLSGGWRFFHREAVSALWGNFLVLDTASDDLLGEQLYKWQTNLISSWRRGNWLWSLSTGYTLSEDSDRNEVSVSPLIGYQPMARYLSYITVGPSYSYGVESKEDTLGVTAFLGKVLPNQDVLALGTQYNLEGDDDNKAFLLCSWKRLF